jgi:hypothetical protein
MLRAATLLVLMFGALPQSAVAQDYRRKPIGLIMPNAPGSSIDVLGRIAAQKLGAALGEQIVVENRAGAGGVIGMAAVKTATADGYTLVAASTAAMMIIPNLQPKRETDGARCWRNKVTGSWGPGTGDRRASCRRVVAGGDHADEPGEVRAPQPPARSFLRTGTSGRS